MSGGSKSGQWGRAGAGSLVHVGLAMLVALAIRFQAVPAVLHGALQDPDSYMRLVRMQDALDAGHWFGSIVLRDASGHGVVLPWSHLLDGMILLLRAPLRLVLPPGGALFCAAVLTGPLLLGALGAVCAWASAPLSSPAWRWTAPLAIATSPAILNYGQLGIVTHHVALVALAAAAWGAAGRAAFGCARSGAVAGALVGAGIWLSPEALPFGMMGLGAISFSWIIRPTPQVARACRAAGASLLAVLTMALVLDPPPAGLAAVALDRLSLPFLSLGAMVAALGCLPCLLAGRAGCARLAVLGGAGLAGGAAWLAAFPGFMHGLAGLMTPEQAQAFFSHIQEMAPLDTPGMVVLFALSGILAVAAAAALAASPRQPPLQRTLWCYAGLCGCACVGLAVTHFRFSPYLAAAAAAMLPVVLHRLATPPLLAWRPLLRPALLTAFLCAPGLAGRALVSTAQAAQSAESGTYDAECRVADAAELLAHDRGTVVLAHVDDGPELLYRTGVAVVGSLYHPNIAGYMRLRAAWRARDLDQPPAALLASGAQALLICPHHVRMALVDGPATTLFDRLNAADPPAWLHAEASPPGSPWRLYRLQRPSPAVE